LLFKKKFTYFKIGDKEYWTMGEALNITIILNRANLIEKQNNLGEKNENTRN